MTTRMRPGTVGMACAVTLALSLAASVACAPPGDSAATRTGLRFQVSFPDSLRSEPLTGRMFLTISPDSQPEPRIAAYNSARQRIARTPFFAADIDQLQPGESAVIDGTTTGYPIGSLGDLPPGDYYVQALLNVYTRFERSDGHTLWAHMDRWEGQRWAFSPGNLVSEPTRLHLDPAQPRTVSLELSRILPPIQVPPDTRYVKRVKIQSERLSKFWGHPFYLGATVLLPEGYDAHPGLRYPVIYVQNHFSLDAPFGFQTEPDTGQALFSRMRQEAGGKRETGYEFYRSWSSPGFPQVIAVTFQHPTPFFDDSYATNSANNGPYGDALLEELIPYLEDHFRMIREPYARVLTGGSTGGWESLALQAYHPEFFGGTWTFYPDPVDFRQYQLFDAYEDTSAFYVAGAGYGAPERMFQRSPDGQPVATVRQISQMEMVSGTHGRSGAQIDAWNAAYGPVGEDGYPRRLWNLRSGSLDNTVAEYMRDHGYDLRHYVAENWQRIGPDLVGKIHVYCGDMDHFYLPLAVYLLEDFLESTKSPYYDGEFVYGRPMKGHGWQPMTNANLVRTMAGFMADHAPAEE